jgi:hypothetical protein
MENRLEGEDKVRMLEREMRQQPSGGGACPKCGAQVRDPFGGRVVVHDVPGCRVVIGGRVVMHEG